tara:strand:+ start:885 stop:1658 length:774 start_codon:yes stop_codon:yes gene_type:complete
MSKLKDVIINHFNDQSVRVSKDQNISQFGSSSNHPLLRTPYEYIEEIIIKSKKQNSNLLDYCCGVGLFSIFPAKNDYSVHGMDFSINSIQIAKERSDHHSLGDRCNFKVMDAEKLEYQDNFFDLIVSYNSLSYLNLDKAYAELNRVLKSGGILIIIDSVGHNPFFKINRNKNLKKWASAYLNKINILNIHDINLANKFFIREKIRYFDFLSVIFLFFSKKFTSNKINLIDNLIMRLPFSYFLAFKYVAIYRSKKSYD